VANINAARALPPRRPVGRATRVAGLGSAGWPRLLADQGLSAAHASGTFPPTRLAVDKEPKVVEALPPHRYPCKFAERTTNETRLCNGGWPGGSPGSQLRRAASAPPTGSHQNPMSANPNAGLATSSSSDLQAATSTPTWGMTGTPANVAIYGSLDSAYTIRRAPDGGPHGVFALRNHNRSPATCLGFQGSRHVTRACAIHGPTDRGRDRCSDAHRR